MKRVLICLILTLACAFGSYMSFMSNDYGPLKHWMAYYKEYKDCLLYTSDAADEL